MKKIIALLMMLCLVLAGCAAPLEDVPQSVPDESAVISPADTSKENNGAQTSPAVSPATATPVPTETPTPVKEVIDYEAFFSDGRWTGTGLELVSAMKIGWNLGNTFDANNDRTDRSDLKYETMWVGTKTTPKMFSLLKEAGFNTVRIPISWHNHVTGDDHTINAEWLDRVQEVVDYAMDEGMYVIINTHHDVYPQYYYPSKQYLDSSRHYIECIWSQVGERFKDYDQHLIFESMNEPRLKGTSIEWNVSTSAEGKESRECINELNQVFTDTVRSQGSLNADRFLMIPGYDASPEGALDSIYKLPEDSAEGRLIVSVHAYTPYNFALQAPNESGSTDKFNVKSYASTGDIEKFMKRLNAIYVRNGIPVVIGEFGARDKGNNTEARVAYAAYYVSTARSYGMSCCWWDNHSFSGSGENFGLLRRQFDKFMYMDIVNALVDNS